MLRAITFFAVVAALSFLVAWLADNPGAATVVWRGYRIETSAAILLGGVAIIALVIASAWRALSLVRGLPRRIRRARHAIRRRRGYLALTRGMVAVAAGDADEAGRQVRRADALLHEPPLTLLLSAQAAQLVGDETAAGRFFTAMLTRRETEFLGVRGLLTQSMKRHDWEQALRHARRAYRLSPDSAWVAANLFDLQIRAKQWLDAEATVSESVKHKHIRAQEGRRLRAVLKHLRGLEAEAAGDAGQSATLANQANRSDPGFIPGADRLARLLLGKGRSRRALNVVEKAWTASPHPRLLEVYRGASAAETPLDVVAAVERLAKLNPGHMESRYAVAAAAAEARLWDRAKARLGELGDAAPAKVYRLFAEIEERQSGDPARGHEWLVRASRAEPDPTWVCGKCDAHVSEWVPVCPRCESFASLGWAIPSAAPALTGPEARGHEIVHEGRRELPPVGRDGG
ncbi:MAG: heme biosynthesis HemY N-terminal domain-containing protein [Rhodospirillales bacterium]|nr:heme biosynthesis HemY N-terminal domain-containing protein [Rhodospirillales bacterium]